LIDRSQLKQLLHFMFQIEKMEKKLTRILNCTRPCSAVYPIANQSPVTRYER
jgi:hypothetical protein